MEHKYIKKWLIAGFLLSFILFLSSPVWAFDTFDVDATYTFRKNGNLINTQYWYSSESYGADFWGVDFGVPIPQRSDGNFYSVYFFTHFQIDSAFTGSINLQIAPTTYTTDLGQSIGSPIMMNVFGGVTSPYTMRYYLQGFQIWGTHGSGSLLVTKIPNGELTYYTVTGILDLNLQQEAVEMCPLRLGFYTATSHNYAITDFDFKLQTVDTTYQDIYVEQLNDIYDAITNLEVTIDPLTFNSIQTAIREQTYRIIEERNLLSTVVDELVDDETDPDLTEWAGQATQFESKNDYLHDLEESLEGTIEDFTFPAVANQTAVSNVVGTFFSNELVIALTLSIMALMIVFLIL